MMPRRWGVTGLSTCRVERLGVGQDQAISTKLIRPVEKIRRLCHYQSTQKSKGDQNVTLQSAHSGYQISP